MLMVERLKTARKESKLTQQQVADLLGIDRSTYAYYELGVSNPSLENLVTLAAMFKVDIEWLLGIDRDENSWNIPENELHLVRAVKEKQITELSKEERQIVALFRIACISEKKKDVLDMLMKAAFNTEDDEE